MEDTLIIKKPKKKVSSAVWKPVMVREDTYAKLEGLANETERTKGALATQMLEFALDRLEVVETEEERA